MKLQECFTTIQGEGLFTGAITTFIRFSGCSLHCPECDTKYSWDSSQQSDVGVPFILDTVLNIAPNPRHICITGGEPMEQPQNEMFALLQALSEWYGTKNLKSITIETNGAQDITWLLDKPFRSITHLSVDFKLPSTGKHTKMLVDDFTRLRSTDLIKFICADEQDALYAKRVLEGLAKHECNPIMLFHAQGGVATDWLPKLILEWKELQERFDIRCNVQLHKLFSVR